MSDEAYLHADQCEEMTGIPASTFLYWAHADKDRKPGTRPQGPPSFKLGRRRVWKRSALLAWIAEQERAAV